MNQENKVKLNQALTRIENRMREVITYSDDPSLIDRCVLTLEDARRIRNFIASDKGHEPIETGKENPNSESQSGGCSPILESELTRLPRHD